MPTIDFRGPKIYSPSAKSTRIGPKFTPSAHKVTPSRCSKIYIPKYLELDPMGLKSSSGCQNILSKFFQSTTRCKNLTPEGPDLTHEWPERYFSLIFSTKNKLVYPTFFIIFSTFSRQKYTNKSLFLDKIARFLGLN